MNTQETHATFTIQSGHREAVQTLQSIGRGEDYALDLLLPFADKHPQDDDNGPEGPFEVIDAPISVSPVGNNE